MDRAIAQLTEMTLAHPAARFTWADRGHAPSGYLAGMALVYGRVYLKHKAGDAAALYMARAATHQSAHDALSYYAGFFSKHGFDNSVDGVPTLRHLFVLLVGLGMAESSGQWYCGRDISANNTSAETAEAGLFQSSWNARTACGLLPALFEHYARVPNAGWLDVFREGAGHAHAADLENYGSGDGAAFQKLSKECPAFAAEFAAVNLRALRSHYGTINRYIVQINPDLDDLFQKLEALIDAEPALFAAALVESPTAPTAVSPVPAPTVAAPRPPASAAAPTITTPNRKSPVLTTTTIVPAQLPIMQLKDEVVQALETALVSAIAAKNPVLGAILNAVLDAGRQTFVGTTTTSAAQSGGASQAQTPPLPQAPIPSAALAPPPLSTGVAEAGVSLPLRMAPVATELMNVLEKIVTAKVAATT